MVSRRVYMGEVFIADLGEPTGHEQGYRRPAVVISPPRYNSMASEMVVVVPLTSKDRHLAHHVPLDHMRAGLDRPCVARCEDMRSISKARLGRFLGKTTADDLHEIREVVRVLLDL